MADRTKLLVVHTGSGAPDAVDVSLVDLRDVVLKQPEVLVEALRELVGAGAATAPSLGGDLPLDTPITKMVAPELAAELTPNARKLTKADILALGGFTKPTKAGTDLGLDVDDIRSLEVAFHMDFQKEVSAGGAGLAAVTTGDIKCCCCPCCCCTAAVELEPIAAIA